MAHSGRQELAAGAALIRTLTAADIPGAMLLKEAAGWNQTEQDWRNVLALAPEGCFGIGCEGRLAATTTAVCYGRDLGWIGMVLTHPDFRGRGFARRLMQHAIDYLRRKQIRWIKLDATDMGRPLYLQLGFADEAVVERWLRPPDAPLAASSCNPAAFAAADWRELDREAFGANRSELLEKLAGLGAAAIPREGFAMSRAGAKAVYFGPCVSRSSAGTRDLLQWFLSQHPAQAVYWDLLPGNEAAGALAREFGFEPVRRLARMSLGGPEPLAHDDSRVYAIAGFEYG